MAEEIEMQKNFYVDKKNYVFRSIQHYDRKKKGAVPEKIYIGKLGSDSRHFIPNKNYYRLYPEQRKKEEAPLQSDSLAFGSFVVFDRVIEDLHLRECLGYAFSEDDEDRISQAESMKADLVLDLACYMIREESGDIQHFPSYCYKNQILSGRIPTDSEISQFFRDGTTDRVRERFLLKWRNLNGAESGEPIFVCYDSTNFNSVSEGISFLEYGYAKDDRTKPQFNLECVIRSKDGLPLAYDTFPGSVIDVRQCKKMIDLLKKLGYTNITIVCDRGYISKENIEFIIEQGYSFLFMVKDNLVIKKNVVSEHGDEIRDRSECYYPQYDIFAKSFADTIYDGLKVYHHVFYTSDVSPDDRRFFFDTIDRKKEELAGMVGKKIEAPKTQLEAAYGKYFDLVYGEEQGDRLILKSFSKNSEKVDREFRALGFYTMMTDKEMEIPKVMEQYKLRDRAEKNFCYMKTGMGLKSFHTQSRETTLSKVFVCFVASIIRSVLVEKTRQLRYERKDSKSYTVNAVLGELSKIEASRTAFSEKRIIRYVLTNRQKTILNQFGIKEEDVDKKLSSLQEKPEGKTAGNKGNHDIDIKSATR